ncbi:drug H+ antiporter-2 family protein [Loigolactobacillus rennini DSM 20253]|uniref:Drug H+ antiporter-2 family protein n=2 Tax=Loigolactobacillus rennini TaxID=238013 RepID=A0A0R2DHN7_9LACO|nr:drug H+ antiporter-2 family protein [Loigolactobacillus rennini DSM 20253]
MQKRIDLKLILAIIATGLLSFCGVIVETAMNITFPVLMREFAINAATVQWMTTAYLLVVAIVVPLSAFLKRRFKTKTLFIAANLLFLLGLIIDALATNFTVLVFGRIAQGLGTGIALPLMFNIIIDWAPQAQKGMLMGIGTLITAIAPALGPTFGGFIVGSLG